MTNAAWSSDMLSALRLGRRLVAEIAASESGRRSFVDIRPKSSLEDGQALEEGWTRSNPSREFCLTQWEYDADRLDGFDYDVNAVLVRTAIATDEDELLGLVRAWGLMPNAFRYPWHTDDPR